MQSHASLGMLIVNTQETLFNGLPDLILFNVRCETRPGRTRRDPQTAEMTRPPRGVHPIYSVRSCTIDTTNTICNWTCSAYLRLADIDSLVICIRYASRPNPPKNTLASAEDSTTPHLVPSANLLPILKQPNRALECSNLGMPASNITQRAEPMLPLSESSLKGGGCIAATTFLGGLHSSVLDPTNAFIEVA